MKDNEKKVKSNSYTKLIREAEREIYRKWNVVKNFISNSITVLDYIKLLPKHCDITPDDVMSLYKLEKMFEGTVILNIAGMPILKIKKERLRD